MTNRVPRRYRASNQFLRQNLLCRRLTEREELAIRTNINQLQFLLGYNYNYIRLNAAQDLPAIELANFDTIYLHNQPPMAGQPSMLLCSVKYYDNSYKTIRVTAQQLEFARLAKMHHLKHFTGANKETLHDWIQTQSKRATLIHMLHPDNIDDTFNVIIDMMEKKGYANRGFQGLDDATQILPNDFEQQKIRNSAILLGLALLLELAYTYLEYTASYTGWDSLVHITSLSIAFSVTGTVFDFVNNELRWGILVDNDAIALSLQNTNAHMNPSMQRIASVARIANDISFLVGSAGNALAFLALLDPLYTTSPIAFHILASLITAPIALIGRQYYLAFNNNYLTSSLNSLAEYLKAERADHDRFYERDIAIAISALPVIVFRSVSFGGVAVLVAMGFHITNGWANLFIGLSATLVTAISILATRIKVIVSDWSNNKFSYLTPEEKTIAWNDFNYNKIQNILLSFDTIESIAVALGLLFLTKFNPGMDSWIAGAVGIIVVGIMCRAQILRQINRDALAAVEAQGVNISERATHIQIDTGADQVELTPLQHVANDAAPPVLLNEDQIDAAVRRDEVMRQVHAANLIFKLKKKPYLDFSYANLWNNPLSVPAISVLVVGAAVISRGLGFLGYVDICNSILKPLTTITVVDTLQLIGLALIFAVSNMRNMFWMFVKNMSSNIGQKIIEKEINERQPGAKHVSFFSAVSPWSPSGLRKTAGEFRNALNAERASLAAQLPQYPAP